MQISDGTHNDKPFIDTLCGIFATLTSNPWGKMTNPQRLQFSHTMEGALGASQGT